MSNSDRIAEADLPALFSAADRVSSTAHQQHSLLTATNLILLLVAAFLGSFLLGTSPSRIAMTTAGAAVLSVCVILTMITQMLHLEQIWYDGRAVAESIKTLAWRYMTCCEPYPKTAAVNQADQMFISDLSVILGARTSLAARLGGTSAAKPQITNRMREVRKLDLEARKSIYLSGRISDQVDWYATKAETNRQSSSRLFTAMVISLILAIISAVLIIRWPESSINPIGFLVNLAVAFLTWIEHGRHEELGQSYAIAAQELGLLRERAGLVTTDAELSNYVSDVERAISKEHTLWLARSDRR